jgi:hypothetical protein
MMPGKTTALLAWFSGGDFVPLHLPRPVKYLFRNGRCLKLYPERGICTPNVLFPLGDDGGICAGGFGMLNYWTIPRKSPHAHHGAACLGNGMLFLGQACAAFAPHHKALNKTWFNVKRCNLNDICLCREMLQLTTQVSRDPGHK